MHEGIENNNHELESEQIIAQKLGALLGEKTGEVFNLEYYDGTFEIDTDTFSFTFTIGDDFFEIRSIEARGEGGLGGLLVRAVKEIAAEEKMSVIASNVVDTAIGFWEKMGFEPTDVHGEYIWEE